MSSGFSSVLPKPRSSSKPVLDENIVTPVIKVQPTQKQLKSAGPPPYRHRESFVPRYPEDFGDGGSFPEIHVAQYPLDMGRSSSSSYNQQVLPVNVDSNGKIKYDVIARQGHSKDRTVYASLKDMVPMNMNESDEFQKPSEEMVEKITNDTKAALEKIVNVKIQASQPQNVKKDKNEAQLIRYTTSQTGGNFKSTTGERVVKMIQMPVDPLDPPKFLHRKLPKPPPSPPPPVLHSPPRKVSAKEQLAWKIPPCISSWKNPKGYTIPLDKRMAHDGRGLAEVGINDNFAKFAESLYVADQHAREEVEKRAALQQKLAEKEKMEKEENLRQMALRARESREMALHAERERSHRSSKFENRNQDREISEKIALGTALPTSHKESIFDTRLYDRSEGIQSGFNDEDAYDVYDKPLFTGSMANLIYQPGKAFSDENPYSEEKVNQMLSTSKFVQDPSSQPRTGPVEFEQKEDPFGLDEFFTETKKKIADKGNLDKKARHE